jgi:hypothetical protein
MKKRLLILQLLSKNQTKMLYPYALQSANVIKLLLNAYNLLTFIKKLRKHQSNFFKANIIPKIKNSVKTLNL